MALECHYILCYILDMEPSRGRPAQRGRTRAKLLEAAATLIGRGLTPTTTEVADEAGVSRRTAYRYFPTQEQLLVESALERLRPVVEGAMEAVRVLEIPVGEGAGEQDVVLALARLDATVRVMHRLILEHEPLLRTIQRLTAGGESSLGVRPRGTRRVDWITAAIEPIRGRLGPDRFALLISALSTVVGFDATFLLRDVRGLSPTEVERVSRWMAETIVHAAVAEATQVAGRDGGTASDVA
jgi:AcrR family transcriptional regulator